MMPGAQYTCITDRAQAVAAAVTTSQPGDIVLFAGKGHEDYQIIRGEKTHFVEREYILAAAGV